MTGVVTHSRRGCWIDARSPLVNKTGPGRPTSGVWNGIRRCENKIKEINLSTWRGFFVVVQPIKLEQRARLESKRKMLRNVNYFGLKSWIVCRTSVERGINQRRTKNANVLIHGGEKFDADVPANIHQGGKRISGLSCNFQVRFIIGKNLRTVRPDKERSVLVDTQKIYNQ